MKEKLSPENKEKMSFATRVVSKSHPSLKSAPAMPDNKIGEEPGVMTKQGSSYVEGNKCAPNNNIFFEERSNHLSSKGD
jgi:hypothetical protein